MTKTGNWSLKLALVLAVATLVWAGAASIAVSALEGRVHGGPASGGSTAPRILITR